MGDACCSCLARESDDGSGWGALLWVMPAVAAWLERL